MGAILSIATTTVGEAIRRRVLLIILMIGVLLLSIIPSLGVLSARSETSTMIGTMFAVLRGTSALIAIILTVYMIPNEIERRTIYTILSKPVQRWQFLIGKFMGAVFALGLMILMMSLVMIILFYIFQKPEPGKLLELARQSVLYFIEMCLLAAVAIFFSTFVTPLVNFFLSIGMWLVGTVLNPLYDSIQTNQGASPIMQGVAKFVTSILPNFANYDVKNPIINPGQQIQNETAYYLGTAGYGLMYITILIIAGILIFDRREV
jgi:ABC-type transport system involved in multi-copper enzyme maturation permease subunit